MSYIYNEYIYMVYMLVCMLSLNADESELKILLFSSLNSMLGNLAPECVHTLGQAVPELKWFGLEESISS